MAVLGINHIPDDHPRREAIEQTIHDALGTVTGDWFVLVSKVGGSWSLAIRRTSDSLRRTLVLGAHQQTPAAVASELELALKDVA